MGELEGEEVVEYHLVLVVSGVGEEGEQWWLFGGIGGGQTGSTPVLNNQRVLEWAYIGLGVCVGWLFKLGWIWCWFILNKRVRTGLYFTQGPKM